MRPAPCKMSEFLTIHQAKELVPKEKPQYGRPVELCCYSFNDERVQSFDRSAMVILYWIVVYLPFPFNVETIQASFK